MRQSSSLELTCDSFILQGGANCSYDFMMVDFTGDAKFSSGMKYCGAEPPSDVIGLRLCTEALPLRIDEVGADDFDFGFHVS